MGEPLPQAKPEEVEQLVFPEEGFGRRDDLVPLVKEYQHTGKHVSKDQQLVHSICECLLARGWSERETAKYHHISRHTIRAMMTVLEEQGKLAPLKQRLSAKLGLLAELSLDASIDLVRQAAVPANVLPIMTGVSLDKKERIDAGAGAPGGERITVEITVQDLREHWRRLKAVDVESSVKPAQVTEGQGGTRAS